MRVGDWVQVRSEAEILQTLDEEGRLDGMPFMPEMFRFCGQRLQIYKRAHKTCDGIRRELRRLEKTVHLDTRCSGEAHGGCQAACLLFWREEWLRPVDAVSVGGPQIQPRLSKSDSLSITRRAVMAFAVAEDGTRYRCQATMVRDSGTRLPWWDLRQYVEDIRSGNVDVWTFVCGALRASWFATTRSSVGAGRLVRWFYDHFRYLWRGEMFPCRVGRISRGLRTPLDALNLQPGEVVRVRSLAEIDETLDTWGQNRGLYFDPEQAPYADRVFRIKNRVQRMVNEETGRLTELKTPAVVLESVFCQGRNSSCRMFCPKSAPMLWREIWLERVSDGGSGEKAGFAALRRTGALEESHII